MKATLNKLSKEELIKIYTYIAEVSFKNKLIFQNLLSFKIMDAQSNEVYLDELPKTLRKKLLKIGKLLDDYQDYFRGVPLFVCDCGKWVSGETPVLAFKKPRYAKDYKNICN